LFLKVSKTCTLILLLFQSSKFYLIWNHKLIILVWQYN